MGHTLTRNQHKRQLDRYTSRQSWRFLVSPLYHVFVEAVRPDISALAARREGTVECKWYWYPKFYNHVGSKLFGTINWILISWWPFRSVQTFKPLILSHYIVFIVRNVHKFLSYPLNSLTGCMCLYVCILFTKHEENKFCTHAHFSLKIDPVF